ncbi:hypothetical protein V1525DRAFT_400524 [Lipomyces kononenkoae]|uniref:Uncharacterized protein n=1 Tax=Lipomyces kononenkoae TaxID=34357 RepID=A0ACC3T3V5_LIPKO
MSYIGRPSIDASSYRERLTYLQESRQRRMHGGIARSIRRNLSRKCSRMHSLRPPAVVEGVDYSYPYTGTLSPLVHTSLHFAGLACAVVLIVLLSRDLQAIHAAPQVTRTGGKEICGILISCLSIIVSAVKLFPKMAFKTRKVYFVAVLLGLSFLVYTVAGENGGTTRSSDIGGKYNWVVSLILMMYWFLVALVGYRDTNVYASRQGGINGHGDGASRPILSSPRLTTLLTQPTIREEDDDDDEVNPGLANAELPVAPPPVKTSAPKAEDEIYELEMQTPRANAAARHRRRRTTVYLDPEPREEDHDDDTQDADSTRNQNKRVFLPPETFDKDPPRRSRHDGRPASVG